MTRNADRAKNYYECSNDIISHAVNFCNYFNLVFRGGDNVPEKWTGELIGKMHNECITYAEVAAEARMGRPYVSMILNGQRTPANGRERLEAAVDRIIERRKEDE